MNATVWMEFIGGGPLDGEWRPMPADTVGGAMAVVSRQGYVVGIYTYDRYEGLDTARWQPLNPDEVDPERENKPWL